MEVSTLVADCYHPLIWPKLTRAYSSYVVLLAGIRHISPGGRLLHLCVIISPQPVEWLEALSYVVATAVATKLNSSHMATFDSLMAHSRPSNTKQVLGCFPETRCADDAVSAASTLAFRRT